MTTDRLNAIIERSAPPWSPDACGVTRRDTQIESLVHQDAYADDSDRHRILLIGGLTGDPDDVAAAIAVLEAYAAIPELQERIALSAIPIADPDSTGNVAAGYPPQDGFFNHERSPEARYLWRYIGFMAPDLVVAVRAGARPSWEVADFRFAAESDHLSANRGRHFYSDLFQRLEAKPLEYSDGILESLASDDPKYSGRQSRYSSYRDWDADPPNGTPNELGTIRCLRLTAPAYAVESELTLLANILSDSDQPIPSPARSALAGRRVRSPLQIAASLVERYGDTLTPVIYTQGVSISGRLRYGALTDRFDEYASQVANLVAPYLSGERAWFGDSDAGANHAGLVWCDEMFDATNDYRYRDLLISIADLYRGNAPGEPPPPCDPDYRTEDFFFSGALMSRAYAITGDTDYLDIQTQFLLNAGIQNEDGFFRHCRSVPYYWGRGNGFAALGYAETLTYLPPNHPDRPALIANHTRHLQALRGAQRPSGMFTQLLDMPGTYQELTSVCMVGYAVARGLRLGWLDDSWRDFADSLWRAASERVGLDGHVVDGCTGTGAVNDRRFYIDRPAEFGQDDRTGNLALWFAVEMARL